MTEVILVKYKKILRKIFEIKSVLAGLFLVLLYLFTRFYGLKAFPAFVDEFIYARWVQQGKFDAGARLVSLTDGKQPLFIWFGSIVMNFISNPLADVRIVSIICGFLTITALCLLSYELFKNKYIVFLTGFLFVVLPFAIYVNRLGIYESLVGLLVVLALYLEVLLIRYLRLDIALVLGITFGLNLLTKTSGIETIFLLPTTILAGLFTRKTTGRKLLFWTLLVGVAICVGYLISFVLLLSPDYPMIAQKDSVFVYSLGELIGSGAFLTWGGKLLMMTGWLVELFSIPFVIFIVVAFVERNNLNQKLLLLLWFLIPFLFIGLFGKIIYPRYLYPMSLTLVPLCAYGVYYIFKKIKNVKANAIIFVVIMSFAFFADYKILTNFKNAPLPQAVLSEQVNGWASGEGISAIVIYLQAQASRGPILIATEGKYGSLPTTAMEIYFINSPQVERMGFESLRGKIPPELLQKAKEMNVYLITNIQQTKPNWPMSLILEIRKGTSNYYIRLYKIRSI